MSKVKDKQIPIARMSDNPGGELHYYIRKYNSEQMTADLHMHDSIQIDYVYSGTAQHMVHNNVCEVVRGDIFVIPPYVPHELRPPLHGETVEIIEFEFLPSFINPAFDEVTTSEAFWDFAYIEPFLVEENLVKPRLNLTGRIQMEVESILNEALRENSQRNSGFELMIKSLLLKLLVLVGREMAEDLSHSKSGPLFERHRDAIKGAINYIEEHFTENPTIDTVAKMFMLSPSFFGYLFKNLTSKTFTEYLKDLRLSKATEMLKDSDKRIVDICYESGFNNLNHFNRTFKQTFGMSPGMYRKEHSK